MADIRNVQLIYDRDHGVLCEGWYTRHDEYREDECVARALDCGLDETDPAAVEAALDEAVAYFRGVVDRADIEVLR